MTPAQEADTLAWKRINATLTGRGFPAAPEAPTYAHRIDPQTFITVLINDLHEISRLHRLAHVIGHDVTADEPTGSTQP